MLRKYKGWPGGLQTIGAAVFALSVAFTTQTSANSNECGIAASELITHADTLYWFGMADSGDPSLFKHGLKLLDEAEDALKKTSDADKETVLESDQYCLNIRVIVSNLS